MTPFQNGSVGKPGALASDMHTRQYQRGDVRFVMSRTELVDFDLCPAIWITGLGRTRTPEMLFGSVVDCLALTPEDFDARFVVAPETYTTTGMQCPSCKSITDSKRCARCKCERVEIKIEKEWNANSTTCSDWILAQNGKDVIQHDTAMAAKQAVKRILELDKDLLDASKLQVPVYAEYSDKATGIVIDVTGLIDIVPPAKAINTLIDLKTDRGPLTARSWRRKVYSDSLHVQAAMYLDLWESATGEERPDFRHIVQESCVPYHVEHEILSSAFLELGRETYQRALRKYCQCLKTNKWPGYESIESYQGWKLTEPEAWML